MRGSGHTRGRWRRVRHREGCSPLLWANSSSTNRAVSTKGVLGCAGDFEKMLYDNAQLARVYLHAWQVTGEPFYRAIVEETLDYVAREMTSPEGGVPASLRWISICTKFYPSRQVVVLGKAVQEITPICFGTLSTTILERSPVLLSQSLSSHGTIRDLTARRKSSIILTKQSSQSKWP